MKEQFYESARAEVMMRIKSRDGYILRCMISLVAVFAIGEGIEIGGVKSVGTKACYMLFPIR